MSEAIVELETPVCKSCRSKLLHIPYRDLGIHFQSSIIDYIFKFLLHELPQRLYHHLKPHVTEPPRDDLIERCELNNIEHLFFRLLTFSLKLIMYTPRYQRITLRSVLSDILEVLHVVSVVFMTLRAVSVWVDTPDPVMIAVSESMEPAFARGDILFISNRQQSVEVGDLPVFWFPEKPYPMVHRAVQVLHQEHEDLDLRYVTLRYLLDCYVLIWVHAGSLF